MSRKGIYQLILYMKFISPQLAANIQHTEQNNTNKELVKYTE